MSDFFCDKEGQISKKTGCYHVKFDRKRKYQTGLFSEVGYFFLDSLIGTVII